MIVKFPITCTNEALKMAWCYRAQEKLRLIHNGFGEWFRAGLTQTQYNKFPNKIKNRYSYKAQATQDDWDDFQNNVFDKVSEAIIGALLVARREAKESNFWNPNLDDDIIDA